MARRRGQRAAWKRRSCLHAPDGLAGRPAARRPSASAQYTDRQRSAGGAENPTLQHQSLRQPHHSSYRGPPSPSLVRHGSKEAKTNLPSRTRGRKARRRRAAATAPPPLALLTFALVSPRTTGPRVVARSPSEQSTTSTTRPQSSAKMQTVLAAVPCQSSRRAARSELLASLSSQPPLSLSLQQCLKSDSYAYRRSPAGDDP